MHAINGNDDYDDAMNEQAGKTKETSHNIIIMGSPYPDCDAFMCSMAFDRLFAVVWSDLDERRTVSRAISELHNKLMIFSS